MKRVVTTFNQKKALVGRGRLVNNFMLIKNYPGHYFYFLPVSVIITNLLWTFVSSSTGRTGPGRPELWWPNIGMAAQLGCSHSPWHQPINWTYSIISFFSILILYVHWKSSFPQYLYPQMYLNLQPEGYLYNVLVGVWYPLSGIVSISNNNVDWLMSNCQGGAEPHGPHGASH